MIAATGGPLAFTFGTWFTWTAVGVAFPILGLSLIPMAGVLAGGGWETLSVFAITHLTTLGWVTMTIMGAAAQMAPALLGTRIRGEPTIPYQYGVFTLSVLLLVTGFARGNLALVAVGGSGLTLASSWFVALVLWTVLAAGPRRATVPPHLPVALVCFVLVVLWGTMLALDLRSGFWPGLLFAHRGLVVHLTLGLGGWFGLMVVGTFYRVVPLVHGARVANARRGQVILALAVVAIAAVLVAVVGGIGWMFRDAAVCMAGALLLFSTEIVHVLQRRRTRAPDLNVSHWYAVVAYSAVLAGIAVGWSIGVVHSNPPGRLGECVVVLFLLGWVTQAIIGQLYKITPFLMWFYRASVSDVLVISRKPDLYHPPAGRGVFWLSNVGVSIMTVGIWSGMTLIVTVGAVVFALSAFILAYLLAYRWIPPVVSGRLTFEWRWRIS
jgi:hypothetical protein